MGNKTIVVTGGSGGIGSQLCTFLAQKGFRVFALDKDDNGFSDLEKFGVIPVELDLESELSIQDAASHINSETKQLDGLVNIAGIFDQFPLIEVENDRFDRLVTTNFAGHQFLTRALFPLLNVAKGRIINLSSETVLSPMPLQSYAFSKKLFEAWSDQLRIELVLLGIKVIKIRAGGHKTPFIDRSLDILSTFEMDSLYVNLFEKIKQKGSAILRRVNNDPLAVSELIYKVLSAKSPNKLYHVNVSPLFRILSVLPAGIREHLLISQLQKWM